MKKRYLSILLIGQVIFAQKQTEQKNKATATISENKQMEEVIVTANRKKRKRSEVPVAISKISQQLIKDTQPTHIVELVNKTPGVLMVNYGNEQHAMSIRQPMTTNGYFLYLEDGLPLRPLGIFNHNALLEINQVAVDNIEIVKGPVSSIYGPEAVGGAVNFINHAPTKKQTYQLGYQQDFNGFKRGHGVASGTYGKFGYHVTGLYADQQNSWMTNSDYSKKNVNVRLDYVFTPKTKLITTMMGGKYFSETSTSINEQAFRTRNYVSLTDFTYRKSDVVRAKTTLEHQWNDHAETFATLFFRYNSLGQNPSYSISWKTPQTTAKGQINSLDFKSFGALAQHTQKFDFLKSNLTAGVLYDYSPNSYFANQTNLTTTLNPDNTVLKHTLVGENGTKLADYEALILNSSAYVQYDFNVINPLKITVGTRYDQMKLVYDNYINNSNGEKKFQRFTSKVGANFNLTKETGIYANFSQGFSPPAVTAIFRLRPGTGVGVVPAEFYENLKPAVFNNYEIGGYVNTLNNKLKIDFALYQLDGENELLSIRQPDNTTDYQSAGKTLHRGVELGINFNPTKEIHIRVNQSHNFHKYVEFKVSDKPTDAVQKLDGYQMPQAPQWIGNYEVIYMPKWLPKFRSSIECQSVSKYFTNQINTDAYAGYEVLNMRLGYKVMKQLEVYANGLNILDKNYAAQVNKGNGATDQATYNVGAPRTVVLGVNLNF